MKNIILPLILISLIGFRSSTAEENKFSPTVDDINTALRMKMWKIEIPTETPKNIALRITQDNRYGYLIPIPGEPGDIVKIMFWPTDDENKSNICIKSPSHSVFDVVEHGIFHKGSPKNINKLCAVGDTLLEGKDQQGNIIFKAYIGTRDE